jgi:hypothetical protein
VKNGQKNPGEKKKVDFFLEVGQQINQELTFFKVFFHKKWREIAEFLREGGDAGAPRRLEKSTIRR